MNAFMPLVPYCFICMSHVSSIDSNSQESQCYLLTSCCHACQVCQSTVGTVSDVCRSLEEQILPWCDNLMNLLSENLASNSVHRNIKPHILSCFSDIALSLGEHFEKYVVGVMQILKAAMDLSLQGANTQDEDFYEYNNQLRVGIIDAFSGILQVGMFLGLIAGCCMGADGKHN